MKTLLVAITIGLATGVVAAQEQTRKAKLPPVVERALSDVSSDDAQLILVLVYNGEQIRLAMNERTAECSRRGAQYRFALVGRDLDMQPGCWMIVPGSKKTLIRLDSGKSLTAPLRDVTVEAG